MFFIHGLKNHTHLMSVIFTNIFPNIYFLKIQYFLEIYSEFQPFPLHFQQNSNFAKKKKLGWNSRYRWFPCIPPMKISSTFITTLAGPEQGTWKGFSPVWTSWCRLSLELSTNALPHSAHTCTRGPWVCRCFLIAELSLNIFVHPWTCKHRGVTIISKEKHRDN